MRFLHLSDLHLGKRVNEFSMLEDQAYILKEILNIIDAQKVEAVLIAGDIYDKVIPSAEAVRLLDDFLTRIAARELPVFLISGNHDSAERIAFGSRLMSSRQIYLSPVFESDVEPITISDRHGEINIYMLPFVKPSLVKRVYPEEEIITYQDAVNAAVQHMQIDTDKRNILLAHQFVTGAARCDSEELSVGGVDDVDASVFDGFDYVALGHLHGPQKIGQETVRHSGTTSLPWSFRRVPSSNPSRRGATDGRPDVSEPYRRTLSDHVSGPVGAVGRNALDCRAGYRLPAPPDAHAPPPRSHPGRAVAHGDPRRSPARTACGRPCPA